MTGQIDPHSENWKDGWQTRDAELGLIVQQAVRAELASLGGRLLATHGPTTDTPNDVLATLGGYLLTEYGQRDAPAGVWTSETTLTADDALEAGTLDNPQHGESRTLISGAVVTFPTSTHQPPRTRRRHPMASAGTAYVQVAFDKTSAKRMASDMAASLRRLADYLDAYPDDAEADEADE